ncbi:hypothetical protein [Haliangium sp.]|uniref:hypothetical protein n=1 Tax=Haliangium sp. TaxID=2663208 RepID=UPI003D1442E4
MSYNRLVFNRLVFNRLVFNRLVFNRLVFNRLVFNSLDGLETTPEGRELLTYVARCALREGDTLVAVDDGVEYQFPGLLALAPAWEQRALTAAEADRVSACLIAHVNAFGESVEMSLRIAGFVAASADEAYTFPIYEAGFFGDVFLGEELTTYACLGDDAEVAMALAPDRVRRVCADPDSPCEVEAVGYCRDVCDTYDPGYGWRGCLGGGVRHEQVVNTFLRYAPGICRQSCRDDSCRLRCERRRARRGRHPRACARDSVLDCGDVPGATCTARCRGGACLLDGASAARFSTSASAGAAAAIDCTGADTCEATCDGPATSCTIDCTGAGHCRDEVVCLAGASCLLDCTDAGACGFDICEGEIRECPGDVLVCGRDCPSP